MGLTTTSKMAAIHSFINKWLKEAFYYCNNCGEQWDESTHIYESCCENPQFGKNIDHCKGLIEQNKDTRRTRLKDTGANADNTWRSAVSIPPRLYADLEVFFNQYGEKLFNDNRDLRTFMHEFPEFCSCNKI